MQSKSNTNDYSQRDLLQVAYLIANPAEALKLAFYYDAEVGVLPAFQDHNVLKIVDSTGEACVAERLALCNSTWRASPAAQDVEVLGIITPSGDSVAALCALCQQWSISAAAQELSVLKIADWRSVSVAAVLANKSQQWGMLEIAQNPLVLSLADQNGATVASILAINNKAWRNSAAAKSPEILKLSSGKDGLTVRHHIAQIDPDFPLTASAYNSATLQTKSPSGVTVAQSILGNQSEKVLDWMCAEEVVASKDLMSLQYIEDGYSPELLIFAIINAMRDRQVNAKNKLLPESVSFDVLALRNGKGDTAAHSFASEFGDAWFECTEVARQKSTLNLRDENQLSVLEVLIQKTPLQAIKYMKAIIVQGGVCFAIHSSGKKAFAEASSISKITSNKGLHARLYDEITKDTEHFDDLARCRVLLSLHSSIINLQQTRSGSAQMPEDVVLTITNVEANIVALKDKSNNLLHEMLSWIEERPELEPSVDFVKKLVSHDVFNSLEVGDNQVQEMKVVY